MIRRVAAHLIVIRFDGDLAKIDRIRRALVGRALVRRDEAGRPVVELELERDKGPPPSSSSRRP